ncbi:MAG: hypothetical protein LBS41_00445 [Streptococcaceae bacterium]|jgi:hypothetical protein|nr:hypothetical protein [Streptococcaceae bacterium]
MNGQYYLINKKGNKFKFYWAPVSPDIVRGKYNNWGVAVIDLDWQTYDPRPLHLRAKPLGYDLQPHFQVLRFPTIDGQEYQSTYPQLSSHHILTAIRAFDKGERYACWISG